MGISQYDGTSNGSPDLDPALSTLKSSPFVVAEHEKGLDLLEGGRAKDLGTHLGARGLGIEFSGLDGVISGLQDEFVVEAGGVGKKSQQQRRVWLVDLRVGWGLGIRRVGQRLELLHGAQKGPLVQEGEINGKVFFVNVKLGRVSTDAAGQGRRAVTSSSQTCGVSRGE